MTSMAINCTVGFLIKILIVQLSMVPRILIALQLEMVYRDGWGWIPSTVRMDGMDAVFAIWMGWDDFPLPCNSLIHQLKLNLSHNIETVSTSGTIWYSHTLKCFNRHLYPDTKINQQTNKSYTITTAASLKFKITVLKTTDNQQLHTRCSAVTE